MINGLNTAIHQRSYLGKSSPVIKTHVHCKYVKEGEPFLSTTKMETTIGAFLLENNSTFVATYEKISQWNHTLTTCFWTYVCPYVDWTRILSLSPDRLLAIGRNHSCTLPKPIEMHLLDDRGNLIKRISFNQLTDQIRVVGQRIFALLKSGPLWVWNTQGAFLEQIPNENVSLYRPILMQSNLSLFMAYASHVRQRHHKNPAVWTTLNFPQKSTSSEMTCWAAQGSTLFLAYRQPAEGQTFQMILDDQQPAIPQIFYLEGNPLIRQAYVHRKCLFLGTSHGDLLALDYTQLHGGLGKPRLLGTHSKAICFLTGDDDILISASINWEQTTTTVKFWSLNNQELLREMVLPQAISRPQYRAGNFCYSVISTLECFRFKLPFINK